MARRVETVAIIKLKDEVSAKVKNIESSFQKLKNKVSNSFDSIKDKSEKTVESMKTDWLMLVAKLGAAFYALKQAFDFSQEVAKAEQSYQAFYMVVKSRGEDVKKLFDEIKAKSGGLISNKTIVEATNMAVSFGIPLEKISKLMEIARYRARVMGTDVKSAFEDIVTGIGRASPMILDNLGIMVKLGEANKEYAQKVHKSVDALTSQEQKLAILDYVLKTTQKDVKLLSKVTETSAEKFQKINAEFENTKDVLGKKLIPIFNSIGELLVSIMPYVYKFIEGWEMIIATFESFGKKLSIVWDWIKNGFEGGFDYINKEFDKQSALWSKKINEIKNEWENGIQNINWEKIGKNLPEISPHIKISAPQIIDEEKLKKQQDALRQFSENWFNITTNNLGKQLHTIDKWYSKQIELAKTAGLNIANIIPQLEEVAQQKRQEIIEKYNQKRIADEVKTETTLANLTLEYMTKQLDIQRRLGKINASDYLKDKIKIIKTQIEVLKYQMKHVTDPTQWQMLNNKLIELQGTFAQINEKAKELNMTFEQGFKAGLKKYTASFKSWGEEAKNLSYQIASDMESIFGDFFFDAMRGRLKSLGDYFKSFANMVLRAISQIFAKMAALQILDTFGFNVGKGHEGGVVTSKGIQKFHSGGVVGGLANDEIPAILQVGEVVLSRNQVKALKGAQTSVIVNVNNQSGMPIDIDVEKIRTNEEKKVVDIIIKNMTNNPAFRQIIRGR